MKIINTTLFDLIVCLFLC